MQVKIALQVSDSFPSTGYGYVYNLKPELAKKVEEAFFTFPWEGSALLNEFKNNDPPQSITSSRSPSSSIGRSCAMIDTGDERLLRLQVTRHALAAHRRVSTKRYRDRGDQALQRRRRSTCRRARSSA